MSFENYDWGFLSGAFDKLVDIGSSFATFEGAMAACVGVGLCMFLLLGFLGKNISWLSIVGGLVAGLAFFAILSNLTGLYDWLKLGFEFTNVAASVFSIGVLWAVIVAAYNLIETRGRASVR